jgi:hypothetical protein
MQRWGEVIRRKGLTVNADPPAPLKEREDVPKCPPPARCAHVHDNASAANVHPLQHKGPWAQRSVAKTATWTQRPVGTQGLITATWTHKPVGTTIYDYDFYLHAITATWTQRPVGTRVHYYNFYLGTKVHGPISPGVLLSGCACNDLGAVEAVVACNRCHAMLTELVLTKFQLPLRCANTRTATTAFLL